VQTLESIVGEYGLERFRAEFDKLYYTLKRVHDNELRLTQKCRQLNDSIADNVGSVSAVLQMTQEEELANVQIRQVNRYFNKIQRTIVI